MGMKPVDLSETDRSHAAAHVARATGRSTAIVFEREHDRYIVIKMSDLNEERQIELGNYLEIMKVPTRECVVVEHDWPEYDRVWGMLEDRYVSERMD